MFTHNLKSSPVSDEHDELFHYTNSIGLKGILSTNSLWATHYTHLNDSKEFLEFKSFLEKYFIEEKQVPRDLAIRGVDAFYQAVIGKVSHKQPNGDPFICSFCAHEDGYEKKNGLLSQWRAYSGQNGFALVFDTKKLESFYDDFADTTNYAFNVFQKVTYSRDENRLKTIINPRCDIMYEHFLHLKDNPKASQDLIKLSAQAFIFCASTMKHQGFAEEQEVRIVHSPVSEEQNVRYLKKYPNDYSFKRISEIRDRGSIENPIRYIELFDSLTNKLPIKRIIIGPANDQAELRNKLMNYLDANKIDIPDGVVLSETPLIW